MVSIKPIETIYNGYRFRSRLEARWAVFFDAAGIEYQYELEGFALENGKWYLPDFYLPKFDAYVEIKHGNLEEDALEEIEDVCAFLNVQSNKLVLLCMGDPVDADITAFYGEYEPSLGFYESVYDRAMFVEGARYWKSGMNQNGTLYIYEQADNSHQVGIAVGCDDYNFTSSCDPAFLIHKCLLRGYTSLLESARKKARQARFEHGETPKARR